MKESIESREEFYKRIRPALSIKIKDIKRDYGIVIKLEEIYKFLEKEKWSNKKGLTLIEVVDDIFQLDINQLFEYVGKRRQNVKEETKNK